MNKQEDFSEPAVEGSHEQLDQPPPQNQNGGHLPDQNSAQSSAGTWHAEAGRKGAHRVHQLMELGLLYEKEHGLKRGKQRLRQLIQEGRLYEQEHGMSPRPRRKRLGGRQIVQNFFRSLLRMVKPAYRDRINRLLEELERE